MANEAKKEYLKQYRRKVFAIKKIESEIEEIRRIKCSPSVKMGDGMPSSHNNNDLSVYAARIDQLEAELLEKKKRLVDLLTQIESQINLLEDERERCVLQYRYINQMGWLKIADTMGYTERWIHKIHSQALNNFEIFNKNS